jgi:hypothetical protein
MQVLTRRNKMTENEKQEILELVYDQAEEIASALNSFCRASSADCLPSKGEEPYPFLAFTNAIAAVLEAAHPGILEGVDLEDKLSDAMPTTQPHYRFPQGHRTLLRYIQEERDYFAIPGNECGCDYLYGDVRRIEKRAAEHWESRSTLQTQACR